MYAYRVTYTCNPSALNEVTTLLKSRVNEYANTGRSLFMMSQVAGPDSGGYRHQLVSFLNDLSGYGKGTFNMYAQGVDGGTVSYLKQIEPLLISPIRYELWEAAVPFQSKARPKAGEYILRHSLYPNIGDSWEVRAGVSEFVQQRKDEGVGIALYWQDLSSNAPVAQILVRYKELEDMERDLAQRDAPLLAWKRANASMLRNSWSTELWAVVTEPR